MSEAWRMQIAVLPAFVVEWKAKFKLEVSESEDVFSFLPSSVTH